MYGITKNQSSWYQPMSKLNSQFLAFVTKQSKRSLLVPFSFLLLTLAYPGHNQLQSIVLRPGPVFTPQKIEIALADYPLSDGEAPPAVASTSYIVQDISSKTVIAQRRPDVVLPPASITKLMTALVALETWPDKNTVLTVQNEDRAIGQYGCAGAAALAREGDGPRDFEVGEVGLLEAGLCA